MRRLDRLCAAVWLGTVGLAAATDFSVRLALPAHESTARQAILERRARAAVLEASLVLQARAGISLTVARAVSWGVAPGEGDVEALQASFPLESDAPNPLTVGLRAMTVAEATRYHAGHAKPFSPWIMMALIVDAEPAAAAWMVRNDAYTLLHEFSHVAGMPHVRWRDARSGASLLSAELEGKRYVRSGKFTSSSDYVNRGGSDRLSLDPLTLEVWALARTLSFDGSCAFWGMATAQGYVDALSRHAALIDGDGAPPAKAMRAELRSGLLVWLHNTAVDALERRDWAAAEICAGRMAAIEEKMGEAGAPMAGCVRGSICSQRYNGKAGELNEAIRRHNEEVKRFNRNPGGYPGGKGAIQDGTRRITTLKRAMDAARAACEKYPACSKPPERRRKVP